MSALLDPITLEICWNRLIGVVNEQAAALQRTSFTSIVREAGDLSAGVFDSRGYMVAQAVTGTPGHINSMALAMKHFLAAYPLERLAAGDLGVEVAEDHLGQPRVLPDHRHQRLVGAAALVQLEDRDLQALLVDFARLG